MSKHVLLIVNPNAGRGKVQKRIPEIKEDLMKTGYDVDIINTRKNFSAKDIITEYNKKPDIVICCGGDGTVNDLVSAVMPKWDMSNFMLNFAKGVWKQTKETLFGWMKDRFAEAGKGKKQAWMKRFPMLTH